MDKLAYGKGLAQALLNSGALKRGDGVMDTIKRYGRKAVDSVITNADGSSVLDPKPTPPPPPPQLTKGTNSLGKVTWTISNKPGVK